MRDRLRARTVRVVAAVCCVAGGVVAAVPAPGGAAPVAAALSAPAGREGAAHFGGTPVRAVLARAQAGSQQAAACKSVLFLGARGSGEKGPGTRGWHRTRKHPYGLGPTVRSAYKRLEHRIARYRTVQVRSVPYPADSVKVMLHKHGISKYFRGLSGGVTWTMRYLRKRARRCPDQQIVLAGFSQGAMVMHRVLHRLGNTRTGRGILARLADAILVGDGDHVPHGRYIRYGSAALNARGIGQALRTISHTSKKKFSRPVGSRVLEVCNRNDIVCGWTDTTLLKCLILGLKYCIPSLWKRVRVHLSYPGSRPLLAAAGRAAADVLALHYNGSPLAVSGTAGTPLSASATVMGGVGTLTAFPGLNGTPPSWLALGMSGHTVQLSGTPDKAGTWAFDIVVQDSRNTEATIPVTITVTTPPTSWTATEAPLFIGSYHVDPAALSCPTTSFCVAVGNYNGPGGASRGAIATWSGGSWAVTPAQLPGNAYSQLPESSLASVSCPTVNYCVAVGSYATSDLGYYGQAQRGLLVTFSGGAWSAAEAPVDISLVGSPPWSADLFSVSCPSTSFCAAVGDQSDSPVDSTYNDVLTSVDGSWQVAVPNAGPTFGNISCPSVSYCMAADSVGVMTWSNGAWKQVALPPPANADQPSTVYGSTLACAAAGECAVAGYYEDIYGYHWPVLQSGFVIWRPPFSRPWLRDAGGFELGVVVVPSGAGLVASSPS